MALKRRCLANDNDKIKDVLFNKAAGGIENLRPEVASSMFNPEAEVETEAESEE